VRCGLMVLSPHVQLGKTIVPILIILQHLRAASGQVYAFADKDALRAAIAAYTANAASATATYGPISSWDVSAVTDMNGLFANRNNFNADISSWDTSRVTDMATMFSVRSASALTSATQSGPSCCLRHRPTHPTLPNGCPHVATPLMVPLSTRQGAFAFNQPLSFDTSSVTDMRSMFAVRSARSPPSASTVRAFLLLAPLATLPRPPARLPACRPSSYAFPFLFGSARTRSTSR